MARGRKTGGRQKGTRDRANEEARATAQAAGILPLEYMRDPAADQKRRDGMAMAAAPYLHPKLSTIDAKLSPAVAEPVPKPTSVVVQFVVPGAGHPREDESGGTAS